jgi:hypothetical protein
LFRRSSWRSCWPSDGAVPDYFNGWDWEIVCLVYPVFLVYLVDRINQIDQTNQTDQIDQPDPSFGFTPFLLVKWWR